MRNLSPDSRVILPRNWSLYRVRSGILPAIYVDTMIQHSLNPLIMLPLKNTSLWLRSRRNPRLRTKLSKLVKRYTRTLLDLRENRIRQNLRITSSIQCLSPNRVSSHNQLPQLFQTTNRLTPTPEPVPASNQTAPKQPTSSPSKEPKEPTSSP